MVLKSRHFQTASRYKKTYCVFSWKRSDDSNSMVVGVGAQEYRFSWISFKDCLDGGQKSSCLGFEIFCHSSRSQWPQQRLLPAHPHMQIRSKLKNVSTNANKIQISLATCIVLVLPHECCCEACEYSCVVQYAPHHFQCYAIR